MNESMERVLDLLQFAEDVSKNVESSASLTEQDTQRFSMFDLEPIPIGPNGIQKVVAKIPPLSWNCSSSAQELASAFRGAAFPVSGIALPSTAVEIPSHYQKDQPYTNVAVTTMDMPKRVLLPESPVAATALLQKPRVLSPMTEAASVVSMSSISTSAHTDPDKDRYRTYQKGQWNERFAELLEFRAAHGHLFVPHTYPPNQKLAQWVKRQRYQYKLKQEGKHSTLSDEREELLTQVGFIWGSHAACWQEHFQSLESFVMAHGHCSVPSDYKPDPSLAVWCKHQRRQLKRFQQGQPSTMTDERYRCLQSLGFSREQRSTSSNQHSKKTLVWCP